MSIPLRKFRQDQKIPAATLAEKVGITAGHLFRIERDGTDKLAIARKLADETGLPIDAFAKPSEAA